MTFVLRCSWGQVMQEICWKIDFSKRKEWVKPESVKFTEI